MWRVDLYGYSSSSLIRKATNREKPKTHDSPVDICMTPLVCRIIIMKAYTCLFSCFSAVLLFFCNHCLHFFFLTYDFPLILIKVNWFERCGLRNDLFFCLTSITFTTRNTPFDCNSQWQLLYEICGGNMWSQYVYISGRHEHIFSPNCQRLSAETQQRSNNLQHMSFDD